MAYVLSIVYCFGLNIPNIKFVTMFYKQKPIAIIYIICPYKSVNKANGYSPFVKVKCNTAIEKPTSNENNWLQYSAVQPRKAHYWQASANAVKTSGKPLFIAINVSPRKA